MKKNKNLLLRLIVILIVLLLVLILIIFILKLKNESLDENANTGDMEFYELENINDYIYVRSCVNKYYRNIFSLDNITQEMEDEEKQNYLNGVKSLLPEYVLQELGITDDNIKDKFEKDEGGIFIEKIYVSSQISEGKDYVGTANENAYYIEGKIITLEKETTSFRQIIILDYINQTFIVLPEEYLNEKNIQINESSVLKLIEDKNIEDNIYNKFSTNENFKEALCKNYISELKDLIKYNREYLYEILDEEYKNVKFEDFDEFSEYLDERFGNVGFSASEYDVKYLDDVLVRCTVVDNKNNAYVFYQKAPLDYTVMLDVYTVVIDDFITKYNQGSNETKMILNIEKVLQAINNNDYKYVYEKIDDTFKANNFSTLEEFKNYIKTKFFNYSDIEYVEFNQNGNVYTYKIKINDKNKENSNEMTIIMKLEDENNFVMSFSI